MSAHTAGPLQIIEAKTLDNSGQWHVYLAAPDGRKIAALWGSQDEKIGNSRLYAAAPEMIDALKHAETIMMMVEPRSDKGQYLECMGHVRAAIKKAEGAA